MKRTLKELVKAAENIRQYGIEDDGEALDTVLYEFINVFSSINKYVDKHGNIALSCGGEWMYQNDKGQVDALELVSDILDKLWDYAEPEEED